VALLAMLKASRGRRPGHQPWPRTSWAAVAAIVRAYGLLEADHLEETTHDLASFPDRLSLCPLLTPVQYQLTQAIINRYDNPYLLYARTPAEIVLSHRLYQCRPDLEPTTLTAAPLSALWRQAASAAPAADSQQPPTDTPPRHRHV